jgi:hypothetical protein
MYEPDICSLASWFQGRVLQYFGAKAKADGSRLMALPAVSCSLPAFKPTQCNATVA